MMKQSSKNMYVIVIISLAQNHNCSIVRRFLSYVFFFSGIDDNPFECVLLSWKLGRSTIRNSPKGGPTR